MVKIVFSDGLTKAFSVELYLNFQHCCDIERTVLGLFAPDLVEANPVWGAGIELLLNVVGKNCVFICAPLALSTHTHQRGLHLLQQLRGKSKHNNSARLAWRIWVYLSNRKQEQRLDNGFYNGVYYCHLIVYIYNKQIGHFYQCICFDLFLYKCILLFMYIFYMQLVRLHVH